MEKRKAAQQKRRKLLAAALVLYMNGPSIDARFNREISGCWFVLNR